MGNSGQARKRIFGTDVRATTTPVLAVILLLVLSGFSRSRAHAQTFTVIHNFSGGDGANPAAGLIMDRGGNLYGTTAYGGPYSCVGGGCGTVFKLTHKGSGWVLAQLYAFRGNEDGSNPNARVVFGPDGALYGTTIGGSNNTIFKLQPPPGICQSVSCPWTKTILYTFEVSSEQTTGYGVAGDLAFDAAGNIYGTTQSGGASDRCESGCGAVYQLSESGGIWTDNLLYSFTAENDGADPQSGVIFDQAGNLYGAAFNDGPPRSNAGTVFELSPSGSGWTQTTLYTFHDSSDGGYPAGGLIFDSAGNLYGTTTIGGAGDGGTVFELSSSGGNWNFNLLYSLSGDGRSGSYGKLVMDSAGNLYGTTVYGGAYNWGSVFKLSPSNGGWIYSDLHDFANQRDGAYPYDGLVVDASGNVYGTAEAADNGGQGCGIGIGCGTVWEITP